MNSHNMFNACIGFLFTFSFPHQIFDKMELINLTADGGAESPYLMYIQLSFVYDVNNVNI